MNQVSDKKKTPLGWVNACTIVKAFFFFLLNIIMVTKPCLFFFIGIDFFFYFLNCAVTSFYLSSGNSD